MRRSNSQLFWVINAYSNQDGHGDTSASLRIVVNLQAIQWQLVCN